ncbi:dihydrofolate reductase family protein [Leucobacter chromiireducens]|uniref:Dihydrofolate reductase n=1 Tax=Leucobacter chromiireducens subsp. solipictus TaxID=398235 RepID=A0ABS1SB95_9MICO|nr:dihydrofolate reductase family protein [Leucobacter chromiireducens]MBL3677816.1 dihydrofolate reductase [Leucobacter chromiireducens subsp. solipictus]
MTADRNWTGRAFLGMSLDGFIAGPGGDLAFLESEPGKGCHAAPSSDRPALVWETFFPQIDTLLMGRSTYEKVLTFGDWPFPGLRVYVLSGGLSDDQPHARVVRSLAEAHDALAAAGASQVYVDGGRTVQAFLAEGWLDELTVSILPIVIGEGVPLFGPEARAELAVRGAHVTEDGLTRITYDVLHSA